jgi:hypothetical protein
MSLEVTADYTSFRQCEVLSPATDTVCPLVMSSGELVIHRAQ